MHKINPIGVIHTPFQQIEEMPIQPRGAAGTKGRVAVDEAFQHGLKDLEGFSHIGISIVRLEKIHGNVLHVLDIDVLNGTPLLDIKPYMEKFDSVENSTSGWMQASDKEVAEKRSDSRFK